VEESIKNNYSKLKRLPIDSMVDELYSKGVIILEEKEMIGTFRLRSRKMVYFLDTIIIPSLHNNCTIKFKRFLEVMEESDDLLVNAMAKTLGM